MSLHEYINEADVLAALGSGWHSETTAKRAVWLANVWLSSRGVSYREPRPEAVLMAGIELAKLATENRLFVDKQTGLLAETVKADSVSVSQSFAPNARAVSAEMQLIESLIKPYVSPLKGNVLTVELIKQ